MPIPAKTPCDSGAKRHPDPEQNATPDRSEATLVFSYFSESLLLVKLERNFLMDSPMMNVYFIFLGCPQAFDRTNRGKSSNIQLFFKVL